MTDRPANTEDRNHPSVGGLVLALDLLLILAWLLWLGRGAWT